MATRRDIENILFGWVLAGARLSDGTPIGADSIVWSNQPTDGEESAPQPTLPYATLNIIGGLTKVGNSDETRIPSRDSLLSVPVVVGQRRLVVSLNTYAADDEANGISGQASDIIQAARDYFDLPSVNGAIGRGQSDAISVTNVIDATVYEIGIDNGVASINSGAGATALSIRDALIVAINELSGADISASNGAIDDELIITSLPGNDFFLFIGANLGLDPGQHVNAVDLVYSSDSGETPLSALIDGAAWEKRSQMDFTFLTKTSIVDNSVSTIETVEGTGHVDNIEQLFNVTT